MHLLVVPSWYPTSEAPLNGIYFAEQAQCLSKQKDLQVGVIYPEHQSLRRLSIQVLRKKHFQTRWSSRFAIPTLRQYGWNIWWKFPPGVRCRIRCAVRLGRRYIDRLGVPDIIHAQSGRWAGAAAARIGRMYNAPYVLTEHFSGISRGSIPSWRWPLVQEGYRHARGISAVSSSLRQQLADRGLAAKDDIEILPNLAPPTFLSAPPSGRPSPPPFRFVTIARLTPQKNVDRLLTAFSAAYAATDEVELHVIGDGSERSALEGKARTLGIYSAVRFHGTLDRRSIRDALWKAHAFVLPSSYETFGVVLLEAMATGLPVVTTAAGGPEDFVTPNTGILLEGGNTADLAEALQTIRNTWTTFSRSAIRSYVREQYGPEPFVRRMRLFYDRAVERMA